MAELFKVKVNVGKITGTLTDFPAYIDLANMPDRFWALVTNGGGDIRAYADLAKTTPLPREVVSCVTATETGELYIKVPSIADDTEVFIEIDGTSTEPARNSTYGSDNVWTDYELVAHLNGVLHDSSVNNRTIQKTANATLTTDRFGNADNAYELDSADVEYKIEVDNSPAIGEVGDHTYELFLKANTITSLAYILCHFNWRFKTGIAGRIDFITGRMNDIGGPAFIVSNLLANYINNVNWYKLVAIYHPDPISGNGYIKLYQNGVLQRITSIGSDIIYVDYGDRDLQWGNSGHGEAVPFQGKVGDTKVYAGIKSDSQILAEYTNQSDPASFFTIKSVPTVTTNAVTEPLWKQGMANGNIIDVGDLTVTRRGFCWKQASSGDPTIADNIVYEDGSFAEGSYSLLIDGLDTELDYRVRAYAVNELGISYGTTVAYTTPIIQGVSIKINDVWRMEQILYNTFRITDYINQQVDICSFECRDFKPLLNQEIEVYYDSTKIFGGVIVKVETQMRKGYSEYQITCKDYSQYLNRELVSERYNYKTPKEIIDDLISEYAPDFTDNNVPSTILEGRVAYYKLDGDSTDEVADNDGTDTDINYSTGKINTGGVFNGSTSKIAITDTEALKPDAFTVSAWVKTSAILGVTGIIFQSYSQNTNRAGFFLGIETSGVGVILVAKNTGLVEGTDWDAGRSTTIINDGEWHHIVGTYDGSSIKLYIDDVLEETTTWTGLSYAGNNYIEIGSRNNAGSSSPTFDGDIDELCVWNRALTTDEISELYNADAGKQYPFDHPIISQVTFNRLNVSQCIETIADLLKYSWYVDADKDIHFFAENEEVAPFNLTETGGNHAWESLKIIQDFSQLKNQIYVIGGEYEGESRSESYVADGEQKQFPLAYKYSTLTRVRIVGDTDLTVGIDGEDEEADYDVFWNPKQKYLRFKDSNYPDADDVVEITGIPLFQVFVKVPDIASIAEYGLYEFKIKDTNLTSRQDAINRGIVELEAYADSIEEGSFTTDTYGLRSGQTITITVGDTDEDFIIQSVSMNMKTPFEGQWSVKVATVKTLGIIRFLQRYLKIEDEITEGETLLELMEFADTSEVSASIQSITTRAHPYLYADATDPDDEGKYNLATWV